MFDKLALLIKLGFLAFTALVIGNLISWEGLSLSDHVKTQMSKTKNIPAIRKTTDWTENTISQIKARINGKSINGAQTQDIHKRVIAPVIRRIKQTEIEEILPTEQQKLKALIRDLNTESNLAENEAELIE